MNPSIQNINCIIVDDEPLARLVIAEFARSHTNLNIVAEFGDPIEAYKKINTLKPDLIFLDIQMPEINGFELLEKLNHVPVVIFCTAFDEFAIQAFESNAIDYLLKPFNQNRFDKALLKADEILRSKKFSRNFHQLFKYLKQNKEPSRLLVKARDELLFIEPEQIYWIEAQNDYCMLHTQIGNFLVNKAMQKLEELFSELTFQRIHRSALVNFGFVKEIKPWSSGRYLLIMKNGDEIESSKSGARLIRDMIL